MTLFAFSEAIAQICVCHIFADFTIPATYSFKVIVKAISFSCLFLKFLLISILIIFLMLLFSHPFPKLLILIDQFFPKVIV